MRYAALITAVLFGCAAWPTSAQETRLSPADAAAAFAAAGFKLKGSKWVACAEGTISEVRDINGDGLPEAVIGEGGTECHGMTGQGYSLVSKPRHSHRSLLLPCALAQYCGQGRSNLIGDANPSPGSRIQHHNGPHGAIHMNRNQ